MAHNIYTKIDGSDILKNFIEKNKLDDSTLDFIDLKILAKNTDLKCVLIESEEDSVLISFEKDSVIQKVYQLTKEGKTFRINVPTSILTILIN